MDRSIGALIAIVAFVTWIVAAMLAYDVPKAFIESLRKPKAVMQYFRTLTWGAALMFAGSAWVAWWIQPESEWGDFRTEATGIAVAVIFFEEVARLRNAQEYKASIIRQMGSLSNDFALDAARIAVDNEWHRDGSLKYAYLRHAHLENAHLFEAHLEGANLMAAHLERANLNAAHLEDANLIGANLGGAFLMGAHLERAILMHASLEGSILRSANLEGAILYGAHLEGANLVRAHFKGVIYDKETQWPDETPPAGTVNVDEMTEEEHDAWREKYRHRCS